MISGDPKSENVIYNIDSRKFEHGGEGQPDFSVIHIHCPEDKADLDPIDDPGSPYYCRRSSEYSAILPRSGNQVKDASDRPLANYIRCACRGPLEPHQLPLNDTDFEHELNVIFQISDQPRRFDSIQDAREGISRLNMGFLWSAIGDQSMSQEEINYEKYKASSAQRAYRRTWLQANVTLSSSDQPDHDQPESHQQETDLFQNDLWDPTIYNSHPRPWLPGQPDRSCPYAGPWFGEVGRMVIWRAQTASRDFMWTLHDEIEVNAKVGDVGSSDKVEKRDAKTTKARKASAPSHSRMIR